MFFIFILTYLNDDFFYCTTFIWYLHDKPFVTYNYYLY